MVYTFSDVDSLFICGDFNARIGNLQDADQVLDGISDRQNIDNTINNHGKSLSDFE